MTRACQTVTLPKKPKYTALGVKNLDTFFCAPHLSAFELAFPSAEKIALFGIYGDNDRPKRALLNTLAVQARERHLPCVRLLDAHSADKIAAVYLPLQRRMAADAVYFSAIFEKYAKNICFSLHTDDFTDAAFAARRHAECDALAGVQNAALMHAGSLMNNAAVQKKNIAAALALCCDKAKLLHTVFRLTERYLTPKEDTATHGKILCRRTVSGLTEWGVHTIYTPFAAPNQKTVLLSDPLGGFAPALLHGFAAACTACGYNVRLYPCALTGVTEHLTVPVLSLSLFTENGAHPFPFAPNVQLSAARFLTPSARKAKIPMLRQRAETVDALLSEAAFSLYEAAEARRAREQIFECCTDAKRFLLAKALLISEFLDVGHYDELKKNI